MKQGYMENDHLLPIETLSAAQHDEEERRARIEVLQAQIAAGTYQIDSAAIAQKLLEAPAAYKILGIEQGAANPR